MWVRRTGGWGRVHWRPRSGGPAGWGPEGRADRKFHRGFGWASRVPRGGSAGRAGCDGRNRVGGACWKGCTGRVVAKLRAVARGCGSGQSRQRVEAGVPVLLPDLDGHDEEVAQQRSSLTTRALGSWLLGLLACGPGARRALRAGRDRRVRREHRRGHSGMRARRSNTGCHLPGGLCRGPCRVTVVPSANPGGRGSLILMPPRVAHGGDDAGLEAL